MLWFVSIYDPVPFYNEMNPKHKKEAGEPKLLAEFPFAGKKADLLIKVNDTLREFNIQEITGIQLNMITSSKPVPTANGKYAVLKKFIQIEKTTDKGGKKEEGESSSSEEGEAGESTKNARRTEGEKVREIYMLRLDMETMREDYETKFRTAFQTIKRLESDNMVLTKSIKQLEMNERSIIADINYLVSASAKK
jgi:hypothetical protein